MARLLRTIARSFARTIAEPVAETPLAQFAIARYQSRPVVDAADLAIGRHVAQRAATTRLAIALCEETGRHQYGCAHRPAVAPWDTVPLSLAEVAQSRTARRRSAVAALSR